MADFQYHGSDSLQTDAFKQLECGHYWKAIEDFQELIARIKFKLKQVKGDQSVEALGILGKLRRGFAEALWHINRPQHALQIIQLCISENCHEFSEVSEHYVKIYYKPQGRVLENCPALFLFLKMKPTPPLPLPTQAPYS